MEDSKRCNIVKYLHENEHKSKDLEIKYKDDIPFVEYTIKY